MGQFMARKDPVESNVPIALRCHECHGGASQRASVTHRITYADTYTVSIDQLHIKLAATTRLLAAAKTQTSGLSDGMQRRVVCSSH